VRENRAFDSQSGVHDRFSALQVSDGKLMWSKSFAPTNLNERAADYHMQLINKVLYILPDQFQNGSSEHFFALRGNDGTLLWEHPLQTRSVSLVGVQGMVYLFSQGSLEAIREADGSSVWSSSPSQDGFFITNDAIYMGTAGNTTWKCAPFSSAEIEKRRLNDASLVWHEKLDPAPDPSLPVQRVLFILGGLLSVLALLIFFASRKRQTKNRPPSPLQEGTVLVVPVVSMPRIKSNGWLLLFIPGIMLLLVATAMAVQWIP